jgi:hypothetical protein
MGVVAMLDTLGEKIAQVADIRALGMEFAKGIGFRTCLADV